ncbi:hypothetical protein C8R45DRAFT_940421 [Mycena sanguinolenta]|nr:hypothetical protein C8R45DRAFT_940421 [Mycena sanguinolenta]
MTYISLAEVHHWWSSDSRNFFGWPTILPTAGSAVISESDGYACAYGGGGGGARPRMKGVFSVEPGVSWRSALVTSRVEVTGSEFWGRGLRCITIGGWCRGNASNSEEIAIGALESLIRSGIEGSTEGTLRIRCLERARNGGAKRQATSSILRVSTPTQQRIPWPPALAYPVAPAQALSVPIGLRAVLRVMAPVVLSTVQQARRPSKQDASTKERDKGTAADDVAVWARGVFGDRGLCSDRVVQLMVSSKGMT